MLRLKYLAARAWLRTLPWELIAIGFLALALLIMGLNRAAWKARAQGAQATIAAIQKAQKDADEAARRVQKERAAANARNNERTTDDLRENRAAADRGAAALRLRIADLERKARARALPRPGGPAGGIDAADDRRLSLTDELALREQCEAVRLEKNALIDWERRRLEIEGATP
jgi:hypothetical protein